MTTHSPQQCDGLWRESSSTQCSFWLNASTIHLRLMYLSTLSLSPLARQLVSCSCPALTARPNTTSRLLTNMAHTQPSTWQISAATDKASWATGYTDPSTQCWVFGLKRKEQGTCFKGMLSFGNPFWEASAAVRLLGKKPESSALYVRSLTVLWDSWKSLSTAFYGNWGKVKWTLVQALRLCTGLQPLGGVEV